MLPNNRKFTKREMALFEVERPVAAQCVFPKESASELTFHTATLVGSRVFVIHSLLDSADEGPPRSCAYWDLTRAEWIWLKARGPRIRLHEAVLVDDQLLVFGSDDLMDDDLTEVSRHGVWKLDLTRLAWFWSEVPMKLPLRPRQIVCEFDECFRRIQLFGGRHTGNRQAQGELLLIDPDTLAWVVAKETGRRPSSRTGLSSCSSSSKTETIIWIFGGRRGISMADRYLDDLFAQRLRSQSCQWSQVDTRGACSKVAYAGIALLGSRLLVLGGFDTSVHDTDMFVSYDLRKKEFLDLRNGKVTLGANELEPTSAHRLLTYNGGLLVVGGYERRYPWVDFIRIKEESHVL